APEWRSGFLEVVIPLNEMMRSLGLDDAYPFLITPAVAAKLDFIDAAVSRFTGRRDGPASQAR
ncbi:MAG: putative zinc-binding metallopeptidase, partial [Woeseiaceae bacterium]|nr:putative zinc-binding metallopeptidase [Woeseiaceae bacterium]